MSRSTQPRGAQQPGSRRHGFVSTVVAPGVLLLAFPLASCGAKTARSEAVPLPSAELGDQIAENLASTWAQIVGTPTERNQLEHEIYLRFQLPIQSCMVDHGWDYDPPPFFEPHSGLSQIPLPSSAWMLRPLADDQHPDGALSAIETVRREVEQQEAVERASNPGFESLEQLKERTLYVGTVIGCQPTIDTYANLTEETIDQDLRAEFEALLQSSITDADVQAYADCLHSANIQADTVSELDGLLEAEARASFEATGATRSATTSAQAEVSAATRQLERQYKNADETCRREPRASALLRVAQPLADFRLEHAAELADADASWAAIGGSTEATR